MSRDTDDLDARLAELVQIRERLDVATDLGERCTLIERRRELRGMPPTSSVETMATDQLIALEASLAAERKNLLDRRMDIGAAGAGGPWNEGLDPNRTMVHNRAVDAASGLGDLEAKLIEVRTELSTRERERTHDSKG